MATRRPRGEPTYPINLERQLFGVIGRWSAYLQQQVAAMTDPADGERVRAAFRRRYPASVQRAEIRRVLALVVQHTQRELERVLEADIPDVELDPRDLLDEILGSVETLVEDSIRLRIEELARAVADSAREPAQTVADSIVERATRTVARLARRAVTYTRFVATRAAANALGAPEYTWHTQRDERVRSSHASLDGRTFNWLTGSPVGHPGEPYGCRCFAVPQLPLRRAGGLLPGLF